MLINEERNLLVNAHEKGYKTKELSEIFNISINSFNRIIRKKKGLVPVNPKHIIIEKLDLKAVNGIVRKAVVKMGYVYKKKSLCASWRERPRCSPPKKRRLDWTTSWL